MKKLLFIARESFTSALQSLWSNKLRSFLTLLGIVIGVTTIIAILSVINGLNKTMTETFANLGTRVLYVERRIWEEDNHGPGRKKGLVAFPPYAGAGAERGQKRIPRKIHCPGAGYMGACQL